MLGGMAATVIGYARVSRADQVVLQQEDRLAAWAESQGLHIEIESENGTSGTVAAARRRVLGPILDRLDEAGPAGTLVVVRLDRIGRSTIDCLGVIERSNRHGWRLVVLDFGGQPVDTGTAMGAAFVGMASVFAQLERDLISERTKDKHEAARLRGQRFGRPVSEATYAGAGIAAQLRADGHTLDYIAGELNRLADDDHRYRRPRGGGWTASAVSRALRSVALDAEATARQTAHDAAT